MKTLLLLLMCCASLSNAEVVREISNLVTRDNVNSRVGINLASGADPTVTLDVNGALKASGATTMSGAVTVTSTLTVTGNAFSVGTSTLTVVQGKVGIGTTTPTVALEIVGDISSTGVIYSSGATTNKIAGNVTLGPSVLGGNSLLISQSDGQNMFLVSNVADVGLLRLYNVGGTAQIQFYATGPSYIGTGNFGIGTATPGSKLHVVGDATISTSLTVSTLSVIAAVNNSWGIVNIRATGGQNSGLSFQGTDGTVADRNWQIQTNYQNRGNLDFMVSASSAPTSVPTTANFSLPGTPVTTGGALCLDTNKRLSKCTSAVDASGNCTCPVN